MSSLKKRKLNEHAPSTESTAPKINHSKQSAPPIKSSKPAPKAVAKSIPLKQHVEPESSEGEAGEDVEELDENEEEVDGEEVEVVSKKTFADLGVIESLCEACVNLGYKHPTPIQEQSIPLALEGKDM